MPDRILRKRAKGWRLPPGSACVTRPGPWGNPFRAGEPTLRLPSGLLVPVGATPRDQAGWVVSFAAAMFGRMHRPTAAEAVEAFRAWAEAVAARDPGWLAPLRGLNLACWCDPAAAAPCHADVLLELANQPQPQGTVMHTDSSLSHIEPAFADARRRGLTMRSRWRHAKTGGEYTVVGFTVIEATVAPAVRYRTCAVADLGKYGPEWCRPLAEFLDGRFTLLDDPAVQRP